MTGEAVDAKEYHKKISQVKYIIVEGDFDFVIAPDLLIYFDVDEDHKVHNVQFEGGCNGNTKGIAALVEGMDANEVINRLEGIQCGFKNTSCPDQLSQALKQALNQ